MVNKPKCSKRKDHAMLLKGKGSPMRSHQTMKPPIQDWLMIRTHLLSVYSIFVILSMFNKNK